MIDKWLPEEWPSEVVTAALEFKQGDVIPLPAFFYFADTQRPVWSLTRTAAEAGVAASVLVMDTADSPALGILTSQTCDITEDDAETPEMPWVSAAPIYRVDDEDPVLSRGYIMRLTGPELPDGIHVADLRIEFPIEKGYLATVKPIAGFADEPQALQFAEFLGRRRQRAAVASALNNVVRRTMQRKAQNNKSRWRPLRERIYKLKLQIEEGTRSRPLAARLWVVSIDPLDDNDRQWFEAWWDAARPQAEEAGIRLLANGYMHGQSVDLALYDSLIELDLRF